MLVHGSSTRVSLYSQSLSPRARELTKADEGRSLPLAIGARDIGARAGAQRTKGAAQGGSRGGERAQGRGAWVGRAPAGSGSGRQVEKGGCRRLERRERSLPGLLCAMPLRLCHETCSFKRIQNASNASVFKKKSFSNTKQL